MPVSRHIGVVVCILTFVTFISYYSLKFGLNGPPSSTGDEPSYDSVGWELAKGNGFSVDYDDPTFRCPYDLAAVHNPELFTLFRGKRGPIAFRPPLFSVVIAGTNCLAGRQFWLVRIINALAMSIACGLVSHYLYRRFGVLAALCGAATFVVVDYRTRLYGRAIMTEAITCLLVALLALAIIQAVKSSRLRWFIVAGALTGLCILCRTMVALWLPGVAITILLSSRRTSGAFWTARLRPVVVYCGAAVLVASPWMVRNCYVLRSFKPLGTQGMMELTAAYSDDAFANGGVWSNLDQIGFYDDLVHEGMSTLEVELAKAKLSSSKAKQWVIDNPGKTLLLFLMKVFNEFRPRGASETVVAVLAVLGLLQRFKFRDGRVILGLIAANALAVGVTWSVSGRFLVPQLFLIHVLAGAGAWWLFKVFGDRIGILIGEKPTV